jgi:hypothetical protein
MKTEIFYLKDNEDNLPALKGHLKRESSFNFNPVVHEIDPSRDGLETHQFARQYVKLLQASIPPQKGITLHFHELQTWEQYFYIEVYYQFGYFGYGDNRKSFQGKGLNCFFPAVAIHDRMVLVPQELSRQLASYSIEAHSLFKTLEMGGVIAVDFVNEPELAAAIKHLTHTLREEFLQEVRAYASYQDPQEVTLTKLAKDMGVSMVFLQHALKDEILAHVKYQSLKCAFDKRKLQLNHWTKVSLSITNESDTDLTGLSVEIAGPVKIRPARIRTDLPARSMRQVEIALMPEDRGEFPIEITFALPEHKVFADWLPVHHIWLRAGKTSA